MIGLDGRARGLLLGLLEAEAPIPVDAVSRGLNITPRQARYGLRKARPWLDSQGVRTGADPTGRWDLALRPEQRAHLRRQLEQGIGCREVLTGDERLQYELVRILTSEALLEAKQLAAELDVSHTTVQRDLGAVAAGWSSAIFPLPFHGGAASAVQDPSWRIAMPWSSCWPPSVRKRDCSGWCATAIHLSHRPIARS